MSDFETVAKQRDAMSMKNRELSQQLEAATTEIARLKKFEPKEGKEEPAAEEKHSPRGAKR